MMIKLLLLLSTITSSVAFVVVRPQRSWMPTCHATTTATTVELTDGLLKTVSTPGNSNKPVQLGDIATVKYACYVPTEKPFSRSDRQKVVVGDTSMIAGWDTALRSMSIGERSIFRITNPDLAYGETGVPPVVPPNAVVEVDLQVLDAQPATTNIDFDSLALDSTPRTASEIAAAFEARQSAKAKEPELTGLEAFLAKAKNFYFYGLFEGETGERPPWFLRPSITFPLAFAIVGVTFYISLVSGAISERGAPVTDELDEIILSSSNPTAVIVATVMAFASSVQMNELGL